MPHLILMKYVAKGAHRPGLPTNDIDAAEIADLAIRQKRSPDEIIAEGIGSGLYVGVYAPSEDDTPVAPVEVALEDMDKPGVVEVAKELGVPYSGTKAEIIERIESARAAAAALVAFEADEAAGAVEGQDGTAPAAPENSDSTGGEADATPA